KGQDTSLSIIKTSTGFGVTDSLRTKGLEVTVGSLTDQFQIVDKEGNPIGISFTTDGNEQTSDDWLVDIYWASTGTTYEVEDYRVAVVDEGGLVTILGGGSTDIIVRNGIQETRVTVSASDSEPPEPPAITSVLPLEKGAEIHFDGSQSL